MLQKDLPAHKKVVIIGGGIIGCSTAFNLARRGCSDVIVLEKNNVGSGASCRAAGQIAEGGVTEAHLQILNKGKIYLEEFLADGDIEMKRVPIFLPIRENDPQVLKDLMMMAPETCQRLGIEGAINYITREEALKIYPALNSGEVKPMGHNLGRIEGALIGGKNDGWTDPYLLTTAYEKHARKAGVTFLTNCPVTDIILEEGKIRAVETSIGRVACEWVVIAAGCWSKKVGKMAGIDIPIKPVRRLGFLVKPMEKLEFRIPMITDELEAFTERKGLNVREDVDGMVLGSGSHGVLGLDEEIDPDEMGPSYQFEEVLDYADKLEQMIPDFPDFDVVDGWASFYATVPDGQYIIDKVKEIEGLVVSTGFMGEGISSGGGAGLFVAELILDGKVLSCSDASHWRWDPKRFTNQES
jgi:glycine/D-amino acid oxidase-like deaminating enzyme